MTGVTSGVGADYRSEFIRFVDLALSVPNEDYY